MTTVKERPTRQVHTLEEKRTLEIMKRLDPIQDSAYMLHIMHSAVASAAEEVYDRISEINQGELTVKEAATMLRNIADEIDRTNALPIVALREAVRVYRSAALKLMDIHNECVTQ